MSIERADATVKDLAQALGFEDEALVIDDVSHLGDERLETVGLVEGARVGPLGPAGSERHECDNTARSWLGVVGGPDTGVLFRAGAHGTIWIGRGLQNNLKIDNSSVSLTHAAVQYRQDGITVTDLDSMNGTFVDGAPAQPTLPVDATSHVQVGSSEVVFRTIDTDDQPLGTSPSHADDAGRILFNRSPRGPVPAIPEPVHIPEQLPERKNPTLAVASILVPLVMAAVMVVAFGSLRFALFALLSPLMALGNYLSGRRTVKKERTGDAKTRREALHRITSDLDAAEKAERARRRAFGPDILELRRRVELPSSRLWERRLTSADALTFRLGMGTVSWSPAGSAFSEVDSKTDTEVIEMLAARSSLEHVEVLANLSDGPVGLIGNDADVMSAARSCLLQLGTHHGPADINVAVLTSEERLSEWEWAQWLPHLTQPNGGVRILTGASIAEFADALLGELTKDEHSSRQPILNQAMVLVVDDLESLHKKSSAVRELLGRGAQNVFGVVLAPVADRLPATVATVVTIDSVDGEFERTMPLHPSVRDAGILDRVTATAAFDIARSMARFDDPEVNHVGGALPVSVAPEEFFDADLFTPEADLASIRRRWLLNKTEQRLHAPIGVSGSGVFSLDLIHDGPHALVAGTTGAGKSEFLRTLVLGLAVNHGPDDLVFVLIDYKGGSAFDRCAALPHVVGLVTDLDEHLAERALQSLEAELHHRERLLREAEASDIFEYRSAGSPQGQLPRLVVVIDEFATMRTELPDFVNSLVGIAQRGRSLGVHLILATQRPSGAVDGNIRANTNLRVALRVQTPNDSTDVIDDAGASVIDRAHLGRCLIRRGEGDLVSVQTGYVSGVRSGDGPPLRIGVAPTNGSPPCFPALETHQDETYLEHIVELCADAAADFTPARRPWLEPLPAVVANPDELVDLGPGDDAHVVIAVADDPANQRRVTRGWNFDDGHLGVIGSAGSGVTTTIRSVVTSLGAADDDRPVWVYAVDHGAGGLDGIDEFDHVADVISGSDDARQARLLSFLSTTLDDRRNDGAGASGELPLVIVAIDGAGAFAEVNGIENGTATGDLMARIVRDGPSVGIFLVVGAKSIAEVPRVIRGSLHQKVVLEQSDVRSYVDMGLKTKNLPAFVPGRALFGAEAMVGQVMDWEQAARDGWFKVLSASVPPSIESLASEVQLSELPAAETGADLIVPFGLTDKTRMPARLVLRAGEHCLIAGPSRSGRTTTLQVLASQIRNADPDVVLVGIAQGSAPALFEGGAGDRNDFDARGSVEDLEHLFGAVAESGRRWVILVDDADRIDLDGGALFELARSAPASLSIVAAVRSSTARQSYGHWTRFIRASANGILLEPDPVADGELLGVRLPRERLDPVAGRGYVVSAGNAEVVQVAT